MRVPWQHVLLPTDLSTSALNLLHFISFSHAGSKLGMFHLIVQDPPMLSLYIFKYLRILLLANDISSEEREVLSSKWPDMD